MCLFFTIFGAIITAAGAIFAAIASLNAICFVIAAIAVLVPVLIKCLIWRPVPTLICIALVIVGAGYEYHQYAPVTPAIPSTAVLVAATAPAPSPTPTPEAVTVIDPSVPDPLLARLKAEIKSQAPADETPSPEPTPTSRHGKHHSQ